MDESRASNIDPYRFRNYRLLDTKSDKRYDYGVKSTPEKEDACISTGFAVEIP